MSSTEKDAGDEDDAAADEEITMLSFLVPFFSTGLLIINSIFVFVECVFGKEETAANVIEMHHSFNFKHKASCLFTLHSHTVKARFNSRSFYFKNAQTLRALHRVKM